jgi:putative flippase GtrA
MPFVLVGAAAFLVGFGSAFTVSDTVRKTAQAVAVGAGGYLAWKALKK